MEILNYINGEWLKPELNECVDVINPATGQVIAKTPLSGKDVVDVAARAASEAFPAWRRTPVQDRVQYLFKLRELLRAKGDEIAKLITNGAGQTLLGFRPQVQASGTTLVAPAGTLVTVTA